MIDDLKKLLKVPYFLINDERVKLAKGKIYKESVDNSHHFGTRIELVSEHSKYMFVEHLNNVNHFHFTQLEGEDVLEFANECFL